MRTAPEGHRVDVAVCLAWIGDPGAVDLVMGSPGPWREVLETAPGLLLIESDESLSRVYHEVKWLLPDGCALLVAPLAERPKARGVAAGTVSWLRRLPLPRSGT
ncbi:hypothetical protein GCM10023349_38100 [Nocardioides conyzicola]|uniref:Uncharacterized protein n=1 Tax=Nocardioides conyzicola TaxID=1651781 RepID=A0ABP8XUV6_9ACTN